MAFWEEAGRKARNFSHNEKMDAWEFEHRWTVIRDRHLHIYRFGLTLTRIITLFMNLTRSAIIEIPGSKYDVERPY